MRNLVIFGAGAKGKYVCENVVPGVLDNLENVFLYDNDIRKQMKTYYGYYVLSLNEFKETLMDKETKIIIATDYWKDIYRRTQTRGIVRSGYSDLYKV